MDPEYELVGHDGGARTSSDGQDANTNPTPMESVKDLGNSASPSESIVSKVTEPTITKVMKRPDQFRERRRSEAISVLEPCIEELSTSSGDSVSEQEQHAVDDDVENVETVVDEEVNWKDPVEMAQTVEEREKLRQARAHEQQQLILRQVQATRELKHSKRKVCDSCDR